jgi:aspartyl-tRNA(Asn)/glutamyl-tRNA(Gln) amidotransferase subunit A
MSVATTHSSMDRARAAIHEHADAHAFIWVDEETQHDGPILAVKDLVDVEGMPTSRGTGLAAQPGAVADAPVVAAFRSAGWGVVGKTNLHELALGPTSGNPHYGAVRNPVDPTRIAGGSSGGSATAVGLGMADLALGTDTGGSIRIPSALCGTAGLRPTHGRIPLEGVWPLSPSFDTVGPMARDIATISAAMVGAALLGPAALESPGSYRLIAAHGWADAVDLDETVEASWREVSRRIPDARLVEADEFIWTGLTVLYAESAASNEAQLTLQPETMGEDIRELMTRGARIPAVDYLRAQRSRAALRAAIDAALDDAGADALLLPTTAIVAPLLGSDPIELRDALTVFTRPFGVTGHPVAALPSPTTGLPVGMQLVGRRGEDERVLAIAGDLEKRWAAR